MSRLSSNSLSSELQLFNPTSLIDMGYASDFVDAMMLLDQLSAPGSYIISSQHLIPVKDFVDQCLNYFNIDHSTVTYKSSQPRVSNQLHGSHRLIFNKTGWSPTYVGAKLAHKLCLDSTELYFSGFNT